VPGRHERG